MRKATWFDYVNRTLRCLVVHSVLYLRYGLLIEHQDPSFGKTRRRLGSQYNNFNSFNGSSSDSPLLYLCVTLKYTLRPIGSSVYSLLYLHWHSSMSNYFLFHATRIAFIRLTVAVTNYQDLTFTQPNRCLRHARKPGTMSARFSCNPQTDHPSGRLSRDPDSCRYPT
jgi:hypothetical protein